jgi:hypothetical protein
VGAPPASWEPARAVRPMPAPRSRVHRRAPRAGSARWPTRGSRRGRAYSRPSTPPTDLRSHRAPNRGEPPARSAAAPAGQANSEQARRHCRRGPRATTGGTDPRAPRQLQRQKPVRSHRRRRREEQSVRSVGDCRDRAGCWPRTTASPARRAPKHLSVDRSPRRRSGTHSYSWNWSTATSSRTASPSSVSTASEEYSVTR